MTADLNRLLPVSMRQRPQLWAIGSREEVNHMINELCASGFAPDRARFTPIVPMPFAEGRYMSILMR